MNNARILLVFVFACTMFYAGAQVPNEPKPEEPVAKKVHWYDNIILNFRVMLVHWGFRI